MVALSVVEHHDAFHACTVHQQAEVIFGALHWRGVVVLADGAADHNAGAPVDTGEHRVEDVAADVVKINVYATGAVGLEALAHRAGAGLVVDAGIKAEFFHHPVALGLAAGDAHHTAAPDLGHLAHRLANRPGRAGYHQGFASFGLADIHQAEIAGHARHAQHIEPLAQGAQTEVDFDQAGALEVGWRQAQVLLHAKAGTHPITHCKAGVLRRDHAAHTAGAHHLAQGHWRDVALSLVHPAAHGRVERQRQRLEQHATGNWPDNRLSGGLPVGSGGQSHGAAGQTDLVVAQVFEGHGWIPAINRPGMLAHTHPATSSAGDSNSFCRRAVKPGAFGGSNASCAARANQRKAPTPAQGRLA